MFFIYKLWDDMAIIKLSDDEVSAVSGGVLATSNTAEGLLALSRSIREGLVSIAGTVYEKVNGVFAAYRTIRENQDLMFDFSYMDR